MKTIEELKKALKSDRLLFATALTIAGYSDKLVNELYEDAAGLLELAVGIYNDLDQAFNRSAFEDLIKRC